MRASWVYGRRLINYVPVVHPNSYSKFPALVWAGSRRRQLQQVVFKEMYNTTVSNYLLNRMPEKCKVSSEIAFHAHQRHGTAHIEAWELLFPILSQASIECWGILRLLPVGMGTGYDQVFDVVSDACLVLQCFRNQTRAHISSSRLSPVRTSTFLYYFF